VGLGQYKVGGTRRGLYTKMRTSSWGACVLSSSESSIAWPPSELGLGPWIQRALQAAYGAGALRQLGGAPREISTEASKGHLAPVASPEQQQEAGAGAPAGLGGTAPHFPLGLALSRWGSEVESGGSRLWPS
jgi:hypothetical protein